MFRLKKLDIQGFKSFVDRTSLTLPTRITAIVGPNGSGKSNICDAVQWVLGEQSARNLRGTTMEDVIFNGSARRRPLGMAEVTITLESRSGEEWAETGGEVAITRRVTRDGESDYILNGKRSRLKDVQEILLGTGLGVRAYSIIEQQKIDLILSTKPQDRRRLIEEAAGVSKYKIRKRQAEVKLEETRANLLRLTDIVSEIERTCASLKRQASRAARWKEQADVLAAEKRRLARLRADRLAHRLRRRRAGARGRHGRRGRAARRGRPPRGGARRGPAPRGRGRARRARGGRRVRAGARGAARGRGRRGGGRARGRGGRGPPRAPRGPEEETEADHVRFVEEAGRGAKAREAAEAERAAADAAAKAAAQALADAAARETDVTGRREGARRDLLAASGRSAEAANRERETALLEDRLGFALAKLEERKGRAAEVLAGRRAAVEEAARLVAAASGTLEAARAGSRARRTAARPPRSSSPC